MSIMGVASNKRAKGKVQGNGKQLAVRGEERDTDDDEWDNVRQEKISPQPSKRPDLPKTPPASPNINDRLGLEAGFQKHKAYNSQSGEHNARVQALSSQGTK